MKNKLFIKILQFNVKSCFQRCFEFFKKISFIKKSVEKSIYKECKIHYHKKSQLRNLALVLALHCYCGYNVKYGLLSKHYGG